MDRTRVGEKGDAGEKCGRLGCVVMANGEARRFGRQKLLEPLHGKAVVLHALDALFSPARALGADAFSAFADLPRPPWLPREVNVEPASRLAARSSAIFLRAFLPGSRSIGSRSGSNEPLMSASTM